MIWRPPRSTHFPGSARLRPIAIISGRQRGLRRHGVALHGDIRRSRAEHRLGGGNNRHSLALAAGVAASILRRPGAQDAVTLWATAASLDLARRDRRVLIAVI